MEQGQPLTVGGRPFTHLQGGLSVEGWQGVAMAPFSSCDPGCFGGYYC